MTHSIDHTLGDDTMRVVKPLTIAGKTFERATQKPVADLTDAGRAALDAIHAATAAKIGTAEEPAYFTPRIVTILRKGEMLSREVMVDVERTITTTDADGHTDTQTQTVKKPAVEQYEQPRLARFYYDFCCDDPESTEDPKPLLIREERQGVIEAADASPELLAAWQTLCSEVFA